MSDEGKIIIVKNCIKMTMQIHELQEIGNEIVCYTDLLETRKHRSGFMVGTIRIAVNKELLHTPNGVVLSHPHKVLSMEITIDEEIDSFSPNIYEKFEMLKQLIIGSGAFIDYDKSTIEIAVAQIS
jgi:hypothetical protein